MDTVRAKFHCDEVTQTEHSQKIKLIPVTDGSKKDKGFFKWFPFGNLEIRTVNPDIKFVPGNDYYVDISSASNK